MFRHIMNWPTAWMQTGHTGQSPPQVLKCAAGQIAIEERDVIELEFRRLNLPANLLEQHESRIADAVHQMQAVEEGQKVNRDEQRAVGHYWLRRPELAPPAERQAIEQAQEQVRQFADSYRGRFRKYLLIGIGGSALGPQLLHSALREPGQTPLFYVFDNTDPEGFDRTLRQIQCDGGLADTLTIVISKSGGTPETRNGMIVAQQAYREAGFDFTKCAVAITQPGSSLHQESATWLARFPIWEWVGGRTSLCSPVGILPAALLGFRWVDLLDGARAMDERTAPVVPPHNNPAMRLALAWHHLIERRGLSHMVVLPYSDRLALLSSYLQQLIMESLGKEGQGLTVFGNKGSTDQHSYVQQLRDGRADFFVAFIRVLCPQAAGPAMVEVEDGVTGADYLAAFQEGTAQALEEAGRCSLRMTMDRVNEYSLGEMIALFERAVGYYAAMIGINAYHQPGVQAGKEAAAGYLKIQRAIMRHGARGDLDELAAAVRADRELVADIVRRLQLTGRWPS
jgi:glucose-6-phosphate isomerase